MNNLEYVKMFKLPNEILPDLKDLDKRAYKTNDHYLNRAQVYNDLLLSDDYHCLVYNDEKKLIGYIGCGIKVELNLDKPINQFIHEVTNDNYKSVIDLLMVDKKYQGKGIGKKLITDFHGKIGNTVVHVGTETNYNYHFYEKIGYHCVGKWKKGSLDYVWCKDSKIMNKLKKGKYVFT